MQQKRVLPPAMKVLWCLTAADGWLTVSQIQQQIERRFNKKIKASTIRVALWHIDYATAQISEQIFRCGSRRTYITHYSLTNKNLTNEFSQQNEAGSDIQSS